MRKNLDGLSYISHQSLKVQLLSTDDDRISTRELGLTGTLRLAGPRIRISVARRIIWRVWGNVGLDGKIVRQSSNRRKLSWSRVADRS